MNNKNKMKFETPNLTAGNVAKIANLFPCAVVEGKVNFDLLRAMLGEEVFADEAYEFTWVGKRAAIAEAGRPIRKTLRPCPEESRDWNTTENLYIEGDNLDVLKLLQESYLGKVKMVYIDPPYNTGSDFIYRDDFAQSREEYGEEAGVYNEDGDRLFRNTETNGRFHSDWCSMIYPRLVLARNLLRDDGMVFISIDNNEVAQLRKLCDEVFGESNFVCEFIWKSKLGKVGTTSTISATHEYIICYSKHLPELSFKMIETPNDGRKESLRQWGQADRREDRPSMWYPITIDGVEVYPIKEDGTEGRWRVGQEMAKELLEKGLLSLSRKDGKYNIHRTFESGVSVTPYDTLLLDNIGTTAKGATMLSSLDMSKIFDYSKPVELLHFFAELCTNDDDLILDFFSGSATTAHAVMQLNADDGGKRKFIMVQLPEVCADGTEAKKAGYDTICEIGKERIRRAGDKIKGEAGLTAQSLDIGFRVLKLADTNMNNVYYAAGDYTQDLVRMMQSNIKEDRTDMDLLFGCLLDWGLPLSMPHTHEKIEGFTVHTYNPGSPGAPGAWGESGGDLIVCFEERIPESVVRRIAGRKPLRAVFRDSGFTSSPEKINVFEIFKLLSTNTIVRVI
jgi:adenine-specific DNA-methyltransferase